MDFCLLIKICIKISGKISVKPGVVDTVKNLLIMLNNDAFKTASKIVIQNRADATDDLNYKIFKKNNKIYNSETVANENDKEMPKEIVIYISRYISPEKKTNNY